MINFRLLINIITILFLVLLQVFIFNKMVFNQIAVPYIYILFILLYPPQRNRYMFLVLCFLLGWGIDIFESTGGINAFACLTIGFLSKHIIRMATGTRFFEIEEFSFGDFNAGQWFFYVTAMTAIHHFLLFFLESFSFASIQEVLIRTLYCSVYTILLIFFCLILFRKRAER